MPFKDKAVKKLQELRAKLEDKETQRRIKDEIEKNLKLGREALLRLEKELSDPENRARAEEQVRRAKTKFLQLKKEFVKKQKQAVAYTKGNPEKALAVAAAAGALTGAIWSALRRKR